MGEHGVYKLIGYEILTKHGFYRQASPLTTMHRRSLGQTACIHSIVNHFTRASFPCILTLTWRWF